jgi:multidrug efflux pump subunit AcrA (membrane-fusion protein)
MLNISDHSIEGKVERTKYSAFKILDDKVSSDTLVKVVAGIGLLLVLALFLPWTQNIRAKGYVTTLTPSDRPQNIQALIGGRIENWYVREGQRVNKGDTIVKISEVKEEYLDPEILERTASQIDAKSGAGKAYLEKAQNLAQLYQALIASREVKLNQNKIKADQTRLKLQTDSMELVATNLKYEIALKQLDRIQGLYDDGIKSLTDLESKRLSAQESEAKVTALENKVNTQRNELLNLIADRMAIKNSFDEKIAKARSDRQSALSFAYGADADVNKLQSQYNAYVIRQQNYYILSPIDGIITQALQSGIGEIVKNGEDIVTIMPADYNLAVEMFVEPIDVPLLYIGEKVRIIFDGWPAIVFSGWPQNSYGTFGGEVFAIDNFISDNGKYRVLVSQDPDDKAWPDLVRVGGGANTITLLNDVSVGYELWRQLNGFPADYYRDSKPQDVKMKTPLSKVK